MTGATGNVGRSLGAQLLEAGAAVRALTRDPGSARLPAARQRGCPATCPVRPTLPAGSGRGRRRVPAVAVSPRHAEAAPAVIDMLRGTRTRGSCSCPPWGRAVMPGRHRVPCRRSNASSSGRSGLAVDLPAAGRFRVQHPALGPTDPHRRRRALALRAGGPVADPRAGHRRPSRSGASPARTATRARSAGTAGTATAATAMTATATAGTAGMATATPGSSTSSPGPRPSPRNNRYSRSARPSAAGALRRDPGPRRARADARPTAGRGRSLSTRSPTGPPWCSPNR